MSYRPDNEDDDDELSGDSEYVGDDDGEAREDIRMPPYDFAKRKVSKLLELMNSKYLDLNPHYQRDIVWSRSAMSHLIDSMLKGYYVPPVIFNLQAFEHDDGLRRIKRTCVDGKQRLTSICEFLNGNIPCRIDKKLFYFCDPVLRKGVGRRKNLLSEEEKENFLNMNILCTEYSNLSQTQEIELFQRVQLGKPLTKAEAFRATQGAWQDFARLYEEDFADVVGLTKQHRASGFKVVLMCFIQIYECFDSSSADGKPRLRSNVKQLEIFCSNEQALDSQTKSHLRFVFELFQDLVEDDRSIFEDNGYTDIKTFSPVELVTVCCLISQKGAERPKGLLKGDILALRQRLREVHGGNVRMFNQCWNTAWAFIDGLESMRGAVDGSTVQRPTAKITKTTSKPRTQQPPAEVTDPAFESPWQGTPSETVYPGLPIGHRPTTTSGQIVFSSDGRTVPSYSEKQPFTAQQAFMADANSTQYPISNMHTFPTASKPAYSPLKKRNLTTRGIPRMNVSGDRKRANLDFGPSNSVAQELEAKRARLLTGNVKLEKMP